MTLIQNLLFSYLEGFDYSFYFTSFRICYLCERKKKKIKYIWAEIIRFCPKEENK